MRKNLRLWTVLLLLCALNSESYALRYQVCCGSQCGTDVCGPEPGRPNLRGIPSLIPAFHSDGRNKKINTRSSAITIEQSDINTMMAVGKSEIILNSNTGANFIMNIGSDNRTTAQNWQLPTNILSLMTQNGSRQFISPSSVTPVAAQVPGATHVFKETFVEDGEQYLNYQFFNLDGDNLEDLGQNHVRISDNEVFEDDTEAPEQYTDSPLDLNDDFMSYRELYDMNGVGTDAFMEAHIVMDAFGTIETPFGTFECLRGSITQYTTPYDAETGDELATEPFITNYIFWVTKEGFRFYAAVSPTASGNTTIREFNMYYISTSTVLPVELTFFNGQATDNGNLLTWATANEKNNAGFEIQRSTDGRNFETIGFVKGNGTSQIKHTYTYLDKANDNKTLYYRLMQVDFDGAKAMSNIIAIEARDFESRLKVYPNPTNGNEITLELPENTEGVEIINNLGQVMFYRKTDDMQTQQIDISQWAQGVYFVKSGREVSKFIKN